MLTSEMEGVGLAGQPGRLPQSLVGNRLDLSEATLIRQE